MAELLFLAGDLGALNLFEKVGGTVGEILGLVAQSLHQLVEQLDIGQQLGGQLLGLVGDLAGLEQVALERVVAVPADLAGRGWRCACRSGSRGCRRCRWP